MTDWVQSVNEESLGIVKGKMAEAADPFGIYVRQDGEWVDGQWIPTRDSDRWFVAMPHQCDAWEITGSYYDPEEHGQAVAELEKFVAEATRALEALKARQPYGKYSAYH